jgi:hypothetical protein
VRDVTGTYAKPMVMIRDGEVGLWPGYQARAYSLRASSDGAEAARTAIAGEDGRPARKPGWEPPPPAGSAGRTAGGDR